jgi:hypothetical protein
MLTATGIHPGGELAGIRYDPHDSRRSDADQRRRKVTMRGKAAGRGWSGSAWRRRPRRWTGISASGPRHGQAWQAQL